MIENIKKITREMNTNSGKQFGYRYFQRAVDLHVKPRKYLRGLLADLNEYKYEPVVEHDIEEAINKMLSLFPKLKKSTILADFIVDDVFEKKVILEFLDMRKAFQKCEGAIIRASGDWPSAWYELVVFDNETISYEYFCPENIIKHNPQRLCPINVKFQTESDMIAAINYVSKTFDIYKILVNCR